MLVTNQWNLRFSISDGILVSYGMKEKTRNQALVACIVELFFLSIFMIVELGVNGCSLVRGCLLMSFSLAKS